MSRDLILEVVARKNSKELNTLADEFDKLARKSDDAGKSLNQTATFSKYLDTQISNTKKSIQELGQEFDRTGNKDVFAKLRGTQGNLKKLETIKRDLTKALGDAGEDGAKTFWSRFASFGTSLAKDASTDFGSTFSDGIAGFLKSPTGLAVAVPVAIQAGTAIGGALLTGIGLAGIGAGIAGQLHNDRVQGALAKLKSDLGTGFETATSSFAKPLQAAIEDADRRWQQFAPGLKDTFDQLAPLVGEVERGTVGFAENLAAGFARAAVASKPLVVDFSRWLPGFGREVGSVFDTMAAHEKTALDGLHLLEDSLSGLAEASKGFIELDSALASGLGYLNTYSETEKLFGHTSDSARVSVSGFAQALLATTQQLQSYGTEAQQAGQATDKVLSAMLGADEANLGWNKSLTNLSGVLKENKKNIDIHTAAGQADISAILGAVQANTQQYTSMIQAGEGADVAAAAYDTNTAALEKQLHKAGLTSAQIDTLVGKYRNVPDKVNTAIAADGLTDVLNDLDDLVRTLNHLPSRKDINVYQHDYIDYRAGERQPGRAAGGPVSAGMPYIVGEKRPELFIPETNGFIMPSVPRYGAPATPRARSYGGGRIQHTLTVGGGGDTAVGTMIRYLLRTGVLTIDSQWVT